MALKEGEPFKKVYGPVFAYLNSVSSGHDSQALWSDAVQQVLYNEQHLNITLKVCSLKFNLTDFFFLDL